jgi:hypothetical protein
VHSEILDKEETHHHEIADRMTLLESYAHVTAEPEAWISRKKLKSVLKFLLRFKEISQLRFF